MADSSSFLFFSFFLTARQIFIASCSSLPGIFPGDPNHSQVPLPPTVLCSLPFTKEPVSKMTNEHPLYIVKREEKIYIKELISLEKILWYQTLSTINSPPNNAHLEENGKLFLHQLAVILICQVPVSPY